MVSLNSGLTVVSSELSFLQLVICFVIGCAIWDAVKYLFRKVTSTSNRCKCRGCMITSSGQQGYQPCHNFDSHGLPIVKDYPPMPECKPPRSE